MTGARRLRLGVLGGTLDPVHRGHVAAAQAARLALALDRVWLMPTHVPAHRSAPAASGWHRFAMAAMAVEDDPTLAVTDVELARPGPTYTWDTLDAFAAAGYQPSELYFITGADAFAGIDSWHRFPELLDRAHFVVVTRPGHAFAPERDAPPAVRERCRRVDADMPPPTAGMPPAVWVIEADTPDVSSSDVRARLAEGGAVDGRLDPRVIAHIRRHGLYGAVSPARTLHGES